MQYTNAKHSSGPRLLCGFITVYPKKYAHGFVVLCFVVVMQSFIMNSHEVFIHIHQGCFAGTGAIVRLPQCQWSKPDGYGKTSQCIATTKHSKAKTVCIFLGIYCMFAWETLSRDGTVILQKRVVYFFLSLDTVSRTKRINSIRKQAANVSIQHKTSDAIMTLWIGDEKRPKANRHLHKGWASEKSRTKDSHYSSTGIWLNYHPRLTCT